MSRSPLTLAASVTAALPGAAVTGVGSLTERGAGRFDAAIITLDDDRTAVVRMPADEDAAADLAAESRALRALTTGVRALLPFRAPEVLGETGSGAARVLVVDYLDGYRVDPTEVPRGRGIAPALGAAIASVHALPVSVVRTDGLPMRTPEQVRVETSRLLERAEHTRRIPIPLVQRWRAALDDDAMWRFESAVILGGATSTAFLLADRGDDDVEVTGALDWTGLSVGDPATDLRWLASAPLAADDVYAGYLAAVTHAPDDLLRERARLYAELEFAKWLVHGHDAGDDDVVRDAEALLTALADGVRDAPLVPRQDRDLDAAMAVAERMDDREGGHTSMQTDTYDPSMLSLFDDSDRTPDEDPDDAQASAADENASEVRDDRFVAVGVEAPDFGLSDLRPVPMEETAPIEMPTWNIPDDAADPADEAARSTRAALRRWGADGEDDAQLSHGR